MTHCIICNKLLHKETPYNEDCCEECKDIIEITKYEIDEVIFQRSK
jgi:phage FluMu protein Com